MPTTFCSYGQVASARQGEIIRDVANPKRGERTDVEENAKAVVLAAQDASETKNYEQQRLRGGNFGGNRLIRAV